jgi:predicted DNA-binding transcriptional regulator YafY
MSRSNRLFEIIQLLRAAQRPVRAQDLAQQLEVSTRTVYRDIVALQATGTPIDGEAGVGYLIRQSYDLPPLNFDREEVEALRVGLMMLTRTGDSTLLHAANRICAKIDALQDGAEWLQVSPWGAPLDDPDKGCVSKALLRAAIRNEVKLRLTYRDANGVETVRTVRPVALVYHLECVMLAAWCELRNGLRHFRTDRLYGCDELEEKFTGQSNTLRKLWLEEIGWDLTEMEGSGPIRVTKNSVDPHQSAL